MMVSCANSFLNFSSFLSFHILFEIIKNGVQRFTENINKDLVRNLAVVLK